MNDRCMIPTTKTHKDYRAYRISPNDSNRMAIVFAPNDIDNSLAVWVEIFDVEGATLAHRHDDAIEMFFVLKGEGMAVYDGKEIILHSGYSVLMPITETHYLQNIGSERLYMLCMMIPNQSFSDSIRNGVPATLDKEDLRVLSCVDSLVLS